MKTRPAICFKDTAEETLDSFIQLHDEISSSCNIRGGADVFPCRKCDKYCSGEHTISRMITRINLSMYPAPCQCKCSYCYVPKEWIDSPQVHKSYEKLFALLSLAEHRGLIRNDASWQVATGEITIPPYKDRIYKMVAGKRVSFHSNLFIYDEAIAQNLHVNPNSYLNFSIDAGTATAWHQIKGYDNFKKVICNLELYHNQTTRQGQILLKYIILPKVNDSEADYVGVIEIMRRLDLKKLIISCNVAIKYTVNSESRDNLLEAAVRLARCCEKAGIEFKVESTYTNTEQDILYKMLGKKRPTYKQYVNYSQDGDF